VLDCFDVAYQHTPRQLSRDSIYRTIQQKHELKVGGLRPDLVLRYRPTDDDERWLVVEVKGGQRTVQKSARAAAYDLLAYTTAYKVVLSASKPPYGLGVAWGEGLEPSMDEPMMLCTPDTLPQALEHFFASA
jgi:poly(3-hydroxybutyrate) depolymerase